MPVSQPEVTSLQGARSLLFIKCRAETKRGGAASGSVEPAAIWHACPRENNFRPEAQFVMEEPER